MSAELRIKMSVMDSLPKMSIRWCDGVAGVAAAEWWELELGRWCVWCRPLRAKLYELPLPNSPDSDR